MTDLTVLISPTPLYSPMMRSRPFPFGRSTPNLITPVMVTLETEREPELTEPPEADTRSHLEPAQDHVQEPESLPKRRGRALSRIVDPNLLSPPVNTFKAAGYRPHTTRHRPTRSQSAPPARLLESTEQQTPSPPPPFVPDFPSTAINKSYPRRSFTSYSSEAVARSIGSGNLLPPPPPLRKLVPSYLSLLSIHRVASSPSNDLLAQNSTVWRDSRFILSILPYYPPLYLYCCRARL